MANPEATLLCFITFLILVSSSSSSARLLGGHDRLLPQRLEAADSTEPAVALKLLGENPAGSASERSQRVNLPCVMGIGAALKKPETLGGRFQPLRLVGGGRKRFGPLVLNMLPKGPVPPSGPSKRINGLNN